MLPATTSVAGCTRTEIMDACYLADAWYDDHELAQESSGIGYSTFNRQP